MLGPSLKYADLMENADLVARNLVERPSTWQAPGQSDGSTDSCIPATRSEAPCSCACVPAHHPPRCRHSAPSSAISVLSTRSRAGFARADLCKCASAQVRKCASGKCAGAHVRKCTCIRTTVVNPRVEPSS